nr:N-U2 [Pinctada fucata]
MEITSREFRRIQLDKFMKLEKVCDEIREIESNNEISELSFDILRNLKDFKTKTILEKCKLLCRKFQSIFDAYEDIDRVRNLCNVAHKFAVAAQGVEQLFRYIQHYCFPGYFDPSSPSSFSSSLLLAVQKVTEKLEFNDLLSRLRETCHFICKTHGRINPTMNEIESLALRLLKIIHFHTGQSTCLRKCIALNEMLYIICNDLDQVNLKESKKMRNLPELNRLFDIIEQFVLENEMSTSYLHRLGVSCSHFCSMKGEIGVVASNLLRCCNDPQSIDADEVQKLCGKLCKECGTLLIGLKRMNKAASLIIHSGSKLDCAVTTLLQMMESNIETSIDWVKEELRIANKKLQVYFYSVLFLRVLFFLFLVTCTQPMSLEEIKHGTSLKVTRLVLYICGDIERNPGPVQRDFRKSEQTPLLLMIYRKLNTEPPSMKSFYTDGPPFFWNQYEDVTDAEYFNIPNVAKHNKEKGTCYKEEDCQKCFQRIIDILRNVMREEIPDDLNKVLRCYEVLTSRKKGSKENKEYYEQCEKEIKIWLSKKQRGKTQKDHNASKSDLQVRLEHQLESLETDGDIPSAIELELMQKILHLSLKQTKTTGKKYEDKKI